MRVLLCKLVKKKKYWLHRKQEIRLKHCPKQNMYTEREKERREAVQNSKPTNILGAGFYKTVTLSISVFVHCCYFACSVSPVLPCWFNPKHWKKEKKWKKAEFCWEKRLLFIHPTSSLLLLYLLHLRVDTWPFPMSVLLRRAPFSSAGTTPCQHIRQGPLTLRFIVSMVAEVDSLCLMCFQWSWHRKVRGKLIFFPHFCWWWYLRRVTLKLELKRCISHWSCSHVDDMLTMCVIYSFIYNGTKKYFISHQFCKLSHCKRRL